MQTTSISSAGSPIYDQPFPLSQAQQVAWFLYKLDSNSYADKLSFAVRIQSRINIDVLQYAFQILVDRHPSLRSLYYQQGNQLAQHVRHRIKALIEVVDASEWGEDQQREYLLQAAQRSLNLEAGLVARMDLLRHASTHYTLLLTAHYIACDRQSLFMLAEELLEIYRSLQANENTYPLTPTCLFKDYVLNEINFLHSSKYLEIQNYWQEQLADVPMLNLPADRSRPATRTFNGASYSFQIDRKLLQHLKELAQTKNVSLPVLLLTAFQILLYRYTSETNFTVGWLTSLRHDSIFTQTVGNFSNLVPLRVHIADNLSFEQLLAQTQSSLTEVASCRDYPFTLLTRQLLSDSQPNYPPICQVAFAYEDFSHLENISNLFSHSVYDLSANELGLNLEPVLLSRQRTDFDLTLEVTALSETLVFSFIYNINRLDATTIDRMIGHFQILLHEIADHSQSLITHLSLLSSAEHYQLLVEWNNTTTDYDLSRCLHERVEAQVEKTPDAIAVTFLEQSLTYRELNHRANQLAHYLQTVGVQPEVLVGICAERSLEMLIGLLGILKAGGAYVPLDPDYPLERLAYMLKDSQVPVLLTQQHLVDRLPTHQAHLVCLDVDWEKIAQHSSTNLHSKVAPYNLAYVIYTSGSTGKPKGVMNTHRGICNRLLWMQEAYQLTETDRVLQKTSFSFDVSVWEFFWTLITGTHLVIAQPKGHRDSSYLAKTIAQEQITTLHFVPSMLQAFLETKGLEQCRSLKRVICSGEVLSLELQERFFTRFNCELHNLYGPTEAAIDVTFWHCQRQSNLRTVPIGRPIANTQIYLLDAHLQPVPLGVIGELYIGGIGVARGYLNRPELTAERFIQTPSTLNSPSSTFYKTGDLARYLPDGVIEYIGRIDHQVKIRGFRIELAEIEHTLMQHSQVCEAVVMAQTDRQQQCLIAYVVPQQEHPTSSALRKFLQQQLPDYMVPSAFVVLSSLPQTTNGKLDRRALPKLDFTTLIEHHTFVSPRTELEQQLAQLWSEILELPNVSIQDNFFDLGGNSLSAIYLMTAIAQQFGRELPLAILLASGTIEQLASVLQSPADEFSSSPLVPIQSKGNKRPFFCVHPAGGHALCYVKLAQYIGAEQPFYGLQAQGFYNQEEPLIRVENMASLYIEAIQTVQSQGPYQIGGWSFGGVVAYEIAQQLHRQGHEVSLLAILDSYVPILLNKAKDIDDAYLVGVLSRVFGGMFGQDDLVSPEEIQHLSIEDQIDYIIDKARSIRIFPSTVERHRNRRILDVLVGTLKATYSYIRQPYPGKVTVFRAREKHVMAPDPTLVWVELFSILAANDIEIYNVPGHHYSFILEPHVQVLADRLKACLE